jgi:hypothetical protein
VSDISSKPVDEEDMVVTPVKVVSTSSFVPSAASTSTFVPSAASTSSSVPSDHSTSAAVSSTPTSNVRFVGKRVFSVVSTSPRKPKKPKAKEVHDKMAAVAVGKTALLEKQVLIAL